MLSTRNPISRPIPGLVKMNTIGNRRNVPTRYEMKMMTLDTVSKARATAGDCTHRHGGIADSIPKRNQQAGPCHPEYKH